MFVADRSAVPRDGPALARYRAAIVDALSRRDFARLWRDRLRREPLDEDVNVDAGRTDIVEDALGVVGRENTLLPLLFEVVRCRGLNDRVRTDIATAIGVAPLLAVAALLHRGGCPDRLRLDALALTVPPERRELLQDPWTPGAEAAWIDALLFLDDALGDGRAVARFLTAVADRWDAATPGAAAPLRAWLATHVPASAAPTLPPPARASRPSTPPAAAQGHRGVLVHVHRRPRATHYCADAWFYAGEVRPQFKFRESVDDDARIEDTLAAIVDQCLAEKDVKAIAKATGDLRFDFVLPKRWLGLAVDQLKVGADPEEEREGVPLGTAHPVIVRPLPWFTSQVSVQRRIQNRLEEFRARGAKALRLVDLDAARARLPDARDDFTFSSVLSAFDWMGTDEIVTKLLDTQVLLSVWCRRAPQQPDAALAMLEQLTSLPANAPLEIYRARCGNFEALKDIQAHLSFVWHFDGLEPPEVDKPPFETPPEALP